MKIDTKEQSHKPHQVNTRAQDMEKFALLAIVLVVGLLFIAVFGIYLYVTEDPPAELETPEITAAGGPSTFSGVPHKTTGTAAKNRSPAGMPQKTTATDAKNRSPEILLFPDGRSVELMPKLSAAQKRRVREEHQRAWMEAANNVAAGSLDPVADEDSNEDLIITIPISISASFKPSDKFTGSSWTYPEDQLTETRSEQIVKEPLYRGQSQLYGSLQLGTVGNTRYALVFDLVEEPHPVLYLDRNQNGDLSDDGGPMINSGSGRFARSILFPLQQVLPQLRTTGIFEIWLFTNETLWSRGQVVHYNKTHFQGEVAIGSQRYTAYIKDSGLNEADYTNDGISLDLNGDGKIDRGSEYFAAGAVARIDGRDYRFVIKW